MGEQKFVYISRKRSSDAEKREQSFLGNRGGEVANRRKGGFLDADKTRARKQFRCQIAGERKKVLQKKGGIRTFQRGSVQVSSNVAETKKSISWGRATRCRKEDKRDREESWSAETKKVDTSRAVKRGKTT